MVNEGSLVQKADNVSSQGILNLIKDAVYTLNQDKTGQTALKLTVDWGAYDIMNRKIEGALVEPIGAE